MMEVTLQYFDGCPNWETTDRHLGTLAAEGMEATIAYELIQSYEAAVERGFGGSPTVLIDGVDPFTDRRLLVGLTCRLYQTESGLAGSPTLDQLREAIAGALAKDSSHDD
ncbi:MAG TPA: thioredoxin family protein [Acidimicrobiia bacterium]|nr:thioredoxin family protein [Acidimicrobiia bacterium]